MMVRQAKLGRTNRMKGICTAKKTTCRYVLKRMARFLNRKSQRYYRLKFADTYYGEMTHYGLYRLAWADVRRTRN